MYTQEERKEEIRHAVMWCAGVVLAGQPASWISTLNGVHVWVRSGGSTLLELRKMEI